MVGSRRLFAALHMIVACVAVALAAANSRIASAADVDYLRDVKPLLQARCYACHGALKQESGLRLDTAELIRKGGESGSPVDLSDAAKSLILARVSSKDVAERMPPEHEGEPLNANQIALLQAWIKAGAQGPADEQPERDPNEHWAFQPVVRPKLPQVRHVEWIKNPVDAFVARDHERLELTAQKEASRTLLLRRLTLDLIGLPPTAEEIAAVEQDPSPDWYERVVDRLLDDPRHGERWGRHWMDVWRYSDWWGLGDQLRNSQKHIWHWRDWIIESLNDDLPYDEAIRLMLAGDELYPNDLDRLRATGYLARNYFLFNRNQWMDESVEHVAKGFLGLTMNCAKCHDHKYDPISHTDYYRMRAFFEPYHVRMDLVPGVANLDSDGIPRAFDGLLEQPTFLFIRGQENLPDKKPLTPGIPEVLEFKPLDIQPVALPAESWQPERRPWVIEAYREAAQSKIDAARARLVAAERKRVALAWHQHLAHGFLGAFVEPGSFDAAEREQPASSLGATASSSPAAASGDPTKLPTAMVDATLERQVAALTLQAAESELRSIDARYVAMQCSWAESDLGADAKGEAATTAESTNTTESGKTTDSTKSAESTKAAARAEREHAAAVARVTLASAELRLHRAAADKRDAVSKEVTAARETLDKAIKAIDEPSQEYTKLIGAQWTATRFFNSGKDDPTVTFPSTSSGRRKALAGWIGDRSNPLTARVAVNHIWMRHLGMPLVPTVFDFGRKGIPPTNPELLDWLAAEFMDSGWSMKHVHRLIVLSATYRMGSTTDGVDSNLKRDPDNQYYWRRTPGRLESQAVRDAVLALGNELDLARSGPPVLPPQQNDSKRRSLYFFHSNNERNLFLRTFDEALVKDCYRREQSIVPQQALALINSRMVLDASKPIADHLTDDLVARGTGDLSDAAFVKLAFQVILGAEPNENELQASLRSMEAWKKLPPPSGNDAQEFARTQFVWVLLNHNDFVTIR